MNKTALECLANKDKLEILSRLEAGEKAMQHLEFHKATLELMDDLRCCGNCASMSQDYRCNFHESIISKPSEYCSQWQSDNLTRQEREIK